MHPPVYQETGKSFLRINANKIELFAFLVKHITQMVTTKQVVTTNGLEVLCIPSWDTSRLVPCDHEEADTRMILHLADAVNEGFHKNLLHTVDTDVVVLARPPKVQRKPMWTTLPEASTASRELLRCGCKKACAGRCKCYKAALKCTALCQCGGECHIGNEIQ